MPEGCPYSLTHDYRAQPYNIQDSNVKALKDEFLKGMCYERRMVEIVHPKVANLIIPQSCTEWSKWQVVGKLPSSHLDLGSTPPRRSAPKDASSSFHP